MAIMYLSYQNFTCLKGERSGSVVECLTRDRGAVGLCLTRNQRHCVVVLEQDIFILA